MFFDLASRGLCTTNQAAMFLREDFLVSVIRPLMKAMDATTEPQQKPIVTFGRTITKRYVQPTGEEFAEMRKAQQEALKAAALKKAPAIKREKAPASPTAADSKKVRTTRQWMKWELDCLARFVSMMTAQEAAVSLQRPLNSVRCKATQLGLVWKYKYDTSGKRVEASAEEDLIHYMKEEYDVPQLLSA